MTITCNRIDDGLIELFFCVVKLNTSDFAAIEQAFVMRLKAEDRWAIRRCISANALKDARTIVQRVGAYVYRRIFPA